MAKKSKKKSAANGSKVYGLAASATAVGAATIFKKTLDMSWKAVTGKKPPTNPADPEVATWEAVTWAAATGAGVALAKLVAQRAVANYQKRSALPATSPALESVRKSTRARR
ncbi:DUF4235 domain-containing protein [Nocardioides sp.]|uniref:DUF4235 domain-containing protein n=1 Tax=Nocardioides sp. TaxID=35761 RepID=UPI00262934B6|nr:DUF4235 domain-containing protein [Nocardioides sp.]